MTLSALLHRDCNSFRWCDCERRILALGQCLCRFNPFCPTFAFCVREYSSLWNVHVACDLTQTNAGCVSGLDLLPSIVGDLSAHTFTVIVLRFWRLYTQ